MTRPKGSKNLPKAGTDDSLEEPIIKPDKPPLNRKPAGPTWKDASSVEKSLTGTLETLGLGVGFINVVDGKIIEEGAPALAKALVDLATVDARYRKMIQGASAPGKYGPLLMAIGAIALPIAKNHASMALVKKENAPTTERLIEEVIKESQADSPIQDAKEDFVEVSASNSDTLIEEVSELPAGFVVPQ